MNSILLLLGLIASVTAKADELGWTIHPFQGPNQHSPRPAMFVKIDEREVLLPLSGNPVSEHHDAASGIHAINFHGASNYESCGLVVCVAGKILMYGDIFPYLRAELMRSEQYRESDFGSMRFEVQSVEGKDLICQFTGISANSDEPVVKRIRVTVKATAEQITLTVKD